MSVRRSKEGDVLHDMSHMYALKSAIEDLLGNRAWLELKESTSTTTWRRYGLKLVNSIELSIETTIKIKDEEWSAEVHSNLEHGRDLMCLAKCPEDVIAALSATLLRQVFLQIGYSPSRKMSNSVSLTADNWKFDGFRTVQIVQTVEQRENLFRFKQRNTIGLMLSSTLKPSTGQARASFPIPNGVQNAVPYQRCVKIQS